MVKPELQYLEMLCQVYLPRLGFQSATLLKLVHVSGVANQCIPAYSNQHTSTSIHQPVYSMPGKPT